ncbi:MAG TPA: hypothetical protein PLA94_12140, partial [Myxococcota bacterium]|nr:hypothetical protein [Myxococcota bacterium]
FYGCMAGGDYHTNKFVSWNNDIAIRFVADETGSIKSFRWQCRHDGVPPPVYDNGFHLEGAERMLTLFTFEDRGSETELTMITIFGSAAMYTDHVGMGFAEGVGIGMDQLAAHLATVQAA